MKLTVAELRRRLTPGTRLRLVCFHGHPVPEAEQGRIVRELKSSQVLLAMPHKGGTISHLDLPKAADLEGTANGFRIRERYEQHGLDGNGKPWPPVNEVALEYVFEEAEGARVEAAPATCSTPEVPAAPEGTPGPDFAAVREAERALNDRIRTAGGDVRWATVQSVDAGRVLVQGFLRPGMPPFFRESMTYADALFHLRLQG